MSVPRRILVVEPDRDQAFLLAQLLAMGGYQVVTVRDSGTALQRLAEANYDLVLAEWSLPEMPGHLLVCEISSRCPTVKTILMSGDEEVGDAASACGAHAWFRKRAGILQLRALVGRVLDGSKEPGAP